MIIIFNKPYISNINNDNIIASADSPLEITSAIFHNLHSNCLFKGVGSTLRSWSSKWGGGHGANHLSQDAHNRWQRGTR